MIGNDIVDLELSKKESNWQRKGFLDKIFTENEQSLIQNAKNQEIMVWNLWTRKEAAYKIFVQETKITGYFPQKIVCEFIDENEGFVSIANHKYYTKTKLKPEYIHTVALKSVSDVSYVQLLYNREYIFKSEGIPKYNDSKNDKTYPVSISNHGKFEKIVFLKNATNQVEI